MRTKKLIWALLTWLFVVPGQWALAQDSAEPEKALAINDPGQNVVNNGIRVRLTKSAIEYLRVTVRNLLAEYGEPGGSGLNLLLDPGYNPGEKKAGPLRTTPVSPRWAWGGGGGNDPQWIQNRIYGAPGSYCNNDNTLSGNQRGVPAALQNLHREHGFAVADGYCHKQFNFCVHNHTTEGMSPPSWIYTPHVGFDPSKACTMDPIYLFDLGGGTWIALDLNIALFIFPTMYMENQPDPRDGWNPPDLWPYTGRGGSGMPGVTTRSLNGWTAANPPSKANYNPSAAYSQQDGTYFRAGDDAAFYINYGNLQVQSTARAGAFRPPGCGQGLIYTGTRDANNEPVYYSADVAQCLRAKSYWRGESNVNPNITLKPGEVPHWAPCDPFDTYRLDGSLNPARDDNERVYPNAPNSGVGQTCGAQPNSGNPHADKWLPGTGTGSGWYGFHLQSFTINPDTHADPALKNTIALSLTAPEMRLEYGLWVDAWGFGEVAWVDITLSITRLWTVGYAESTRLDANARIRLESIDDQSCTPGSQACSGMYNPWNDGKTIPDKLLINILMNPVNDFSLQPLNFIGTSQCVINIDPFGCLINFQQVLNLIKDMVTDVVEEELGGVILDLLGDITTAVPNLSSMLGDPWNFGTGLIEYGLFAAGEVGGHDGGNPPKWPVRFFNGPGGAGGVDKIGDIRLGVGFKPVAFRPPSGPNNLMQIDNNDPPCKASDPRPSCTSLPNPSLASVYGVPKLIEPDTSTCLYASTGNYTTYRKRATGTYTYSQSTGVINFTYTTGSGDLRVGDIIYDVSTGKGLPLLSLYNVGAGQNAIMNGGAFEVRTGTIEGISGLTPAQMNGIAKTMSLVDSSTNGRDIITEKVGTTKIFLRGDYDAAKFNGGAFKLLNCSGPGAFPAPDDDGQYDAGDTVVTGTFNDTKAGVLYTASQVIKEYWQGPIEKGKGPPKWCVTPNDLRTGATGNDFGYLYPQTTWLSFDSTYDRNPQGQTVARNTFGGWDSMDPNTVLRQNVNTGQKETSAIPYDASIHIHQRTFASLLQALVASGITCLEFSTVDTDGSTTPWADFLNVKSFAAFMPSLASIYPGDATVSVRISPEKTPHLRTAVGRLSYMPRERLKDPLGGPLPINNERYTFGIAFPDLKIEVAAYENGVEMPVMTMYWSTTFGFYTKSVRACYKLDPLYGQPACTATQVNERSVAGYSEFFVDLNSNSLAREFENGRDGFPIGQFSNRDIGTARGESSFVIAQTICDLAPSRCDKIGLSQAIPMLANSLIQMFFVSRFSMYDFTLDTLYFGPDGPNDDGIGGGDYVGIYAKMIGDLDIFGMIDSLSGGGEEEAATARSRFDHSLLPKATVKALSQETYITTNAPTFDVNLTGAVGKSNAVNSYSYQVDNGFWHTPIADEKLQIQGLLEGKHKLALKAFSDTPDGAYAQVTPTILSFIVDTLPPEVTIHPSEQGFWKNRVRFDAADYQASPEQMTYSYSLNEGKWVDTTETSISLSDVEPGRHTLRVKATDLAGNEGMSSRVIVVKGSRWGCASSGNGDATWVFVILTLLALRFGRRQRV